MCNVLSARIVKVCLLLMVVMAVHSVEQVFADGYRKKISIDNTKVFNENLKDFPVLISLTDPDLKSKSNGNDIYFTLSDNNTTLSHELVSFDSRKGEMKAWLRVPLLSSTKDTDLYLCYGGGMKESTGTVFDSHYTMVKHLKNANNPEIQVPDSENLSFTDEITVEAWVYSDNYQAEALQPIVSKWLLNTSFNSFAAYDAGNTDGMKTIGYFGSIFDGRYVYFSPQRDGSDYHSVHGRVLRYDTQGDFKDPKSYAAYDAGNTDDLNTKGYYGAAYDGRYVYFIPRHIGYEFHSRTLRYDTHMDFRSSESWEAYDVGEALSKQSAAFDGRYIYWNPGYQGDPMTAESEKNISGKVVRFDTKGGFKNPSNWRTFDTKTLSKALIGNYDGSLFDGRYIYFVPLTKSNTLRYDTKGDFADKKSWEIFDAVKTKGMELCVGAIFDTRYVYYIPYGQSNVIRYDTHGDFENVRSWKNYDAGNTDGIDTGGYDGGFFDGRYVYFVPYTRQNDENESRYHGNYLRYDTTGKFNSTSSWDAFDTFPTDNLDTKGYNAGSFDGRFFYAAPWNGGEVGIHARIVRYDTTGENATFCLKYSDYGHNGGLGAAVPGPSFTVNTQNGTLNVFANRVIVPGWHHIAGVYNGSTMKLFIDGILVNERSGSGTIQNNSAKVEIGRLQKGEAHMKGIIDEVRISNIARNDNWIKTGYRNLVNPTEFVRVGEEEAVR